jgi:phenylalanyl-tRNA synthetase alpha chain
MINRIQELLKAVEGFEIKDRSTLEEFRLKFLAKKGSINALFKDFKSVEPSEKAKVGALLNQLKTSAQEKFELGDKEMDSTGSADPELDQTLPGLRMPKGSIHPVNIVLEEMSEIFKYLGFSVSEGPEIEDDWHNFSALNFPENHPARDMQDTFFVEKDVALRTHTSSVQVRIMETHEPPIKSIMPGRVYRNEAISARSNCFFHQIEGLHIDEGVSFADLKQTLYRFVKEFFGKTEVRFRPSYFPFTEPSAEMDIYLGTETEEDYRLTKGTGWLEILGCGMVDENVLKNCGIDPEKYTGYAFGLGVERIAMFKYGIKDIRTLFENDVRFLQQFHNQSFL